MRHNGNPKRPANKVRRCAGRVKQRWMRNVLYACKSEHLDVRLSHSRAEPDLT